MPPTRLVEGAVPPMGALVAGMARSYTHIPIP
jgi:hypothetical protein